MKDKICVCTYIDNSLMEANTKNWITGRSQTSWLYIKRKLRTNPESVRVEGLNQELPDYKTSALNTRSLCLS